VTPSCIQMSSVPNTNTGAGAVGGALLLPWMKSKLEPKPTHGARSARPRGSHGALRFRTRARVGAYRECGCWRIMDRGAGHVGRLGAGRATGLGARAGLPCTPRCSLAVLLSAAPCGRSRRAQRISSLPPASSLPIPLTWRWKLQTGADVDLSQSMPARRQSPHTA
jgi:hypothetical protein